MEQRAGLAWHMCTVQDAGTTLHHGVSLVFSFQPTRGRHTHMHCPQGCAPSQRIFRLLHSTQAFVVEILREPDGRTAFPLSPSEVIEVDDA